ncbi:hypothetical protein [Achromobacter sp.]|uniref:hypothetical protein n=1 Tax=Achromobacter sp. TaxID=134375 RepID=UPI003C72FEBA
MSENVIVRKIKSDAGILVEYHIDGVSDWNFFDSLLEFFKKQYGAVVENFTDGIFTRSYQLRVNGEYFILEHNEDIGNWFSPVPNPETRLSCTLLPMISRVD